MAASTIYDPLATSPANKVTGEVHNVNVTVDRHVIPDHAPFYDAQFGLIVEGRVGAGAWESLLPNVDFNYSPYYLQASAKTGKQVFTYFVLVKDVDEVRLTYQAVGQYSDSVLLAEVATKMASGTFDPSKVHEWDKVWGSEAYYNARVRDPDLHDKSEMEVFHLGIQRLIDAISNPNSSTVVTTADITKLQTDVANAATVGDVNDAYLVPSTPTMTAVANTTVSSISLPSSLLTASMVVSFTAVTGETQIGTLLLARNSGSATWDQTFTGEIFSDANMLTIDAITNTGQLLVNVTPDRNGVLSVKLIFAT